VLVLMVACSDAADGTLEMTPEANCTLAAAACRCAEELAGAGAAHAALVRISTLICSIDYTIMGPPSCPHLYSKWLVALKEGPSFSRGAPGSLSQPKNLRA
jgi:hypothetical protein